MTRAYRAESGLSGPPAPVVAAGGEPATSAPSRVSPVPLRRTTDLDMPTPGPSWPRLHCARAPSRSPFLAASRSAVRRRLRHSKRRRWFA
jgi:hypothetical protein